MHNTLADRFKKAHLDAVKIGMDAYSEYHRLLQRIASFYGVGIVPTVETFASISPNLDYKNNLVGTIHLLQMHTRSPLTCRAQGYPANRTKAREILQGNSSFLDIVKGMKITAFRHNILYPATSKQVTVDGHIYALRFPDLVKTVKQAARIASPKNYRMIEAEIQAIAKTEQLLPHQVQAILWYDRRIKLNIYNTAQKHLFNSVEGFNADELLTQLLE